MERTLVEKIADAVLYEGYMLYPYRASSVKNRQRFNWGALAPKTYSDAEKGTEAWTMKTECLIRANADTVLNIKVRFLQLSSRAIGRVTADPKKKPEVVESLEVAGNLYQAWQEAIERDVELMPVGLGQVHSVAFPFSFPFKRDTEELHEADGTLAGLIIRTHEAISGEVHFTAAKLETEDRDAAHPDVYRITVDVANTTPFKNNKTTVRDDALLRSIVSTHTILHVTAGEFVSLMDPPASLAAEAAACQNVGAYPVLAGEEGSSDYMLSSPIILYDHPQIAPESPGDLFDGTEIDEILTLRIMTLTEEEKREMRSVDDRARKILERTEMMPEEQLLKMHGALRGLQKSKKASYG